MRVAAGSAFERLGLCVDEINAGEGDEVAWTKHDFLDRESVDAGASGATEILQNVAVIAFPEQGVVAGYLPILQDQVVVERTADSDGRRSQVECAIALHDQVGAERLIVRRARE